MTATVMSRPRPTDPIGSIGWTERTGGVLPTAATFLPKLRLAPRVAVH